MKKLFLFCVLCIFSLPEQTFAEINEITIGIEGMTCTRCSYGNKKTLEKLDSVLTAEVSFKDGIAKIILKDGEILDPVLLKNTIEKAGFTPTFINVSLTGMVNNKEGKWVIVITNPDQKFTLDDNAKLKDLTKIDKVESKRVFISATIDPQSLTLSIYNFQIK